MSLLNYLEWKKLVKKYTLNRTLLRLLGIALFVLLWQILATVIGETSFIFPSPYLTIKEAINMLKDAYIYKCLLQTLIRMLCGFGISFVLAFIFGVLAGNYKYIEELLSPTISILRSVPTASLVYLFLVIAGAKITPLLIVVLISFPILYESVVGGIKSTPENLLEVCELEGASFISINKEIRIPLAMPYIIVGIASSFGLSLKIEIMAEVITGFTRLGLGSAILAAQRSDPTNMVPVFAYSFVTIILILIIDSVSNFYKTKYDK